ncbi:MAG: hypothetical protein DRP60_17335 [Spirochaetes bacterium]|nr:MAG: hypothetical protein DRP60_17335 [Spirochaetota bacterium]
MNNDVEFSNAGDVLKTLFERILPEEKDEYYHFFSGWETIAGSETAMHVFPRDIVNNVLVLETDHPLWSQQIRMRQEGLLKIIRGKYPALEIKRIRIVIGNKTQLKTQQNKSIAQNKLSNSEPTENTKESQSFFDLLETMRRRGDS